MTMFKKSVSLIFWLALLQTAHATNTDSLTFYFKNSGREVKQKDSADYYRVILPPDTNVDRELYRVFEYYPNGKTKSVATSLTQPYNLVLNGTRIEFFPNGKRMRISQYKKGRLVDTVRNYYPNGYLYSTLKIDEQNTGFELYYNNFLLSVPYRYKSQIVELRDSTGKLLVEKGTGHVLLYDDNFKQLLEEGDIKNDKKEGEWRGMIADSGKFICTFHKNELKSGISYMKSGHHYEFKEIYTRPAFGDFQDAFGYFIKKNLQYPESARKYKVNGSVMVEFYVEPNGTLSDVKVSQGLLKSLDEEAVRVVSLSPLWYPATRFGVPFRTRQTVTVSFYQAYFDHSH